MEDAEEQESRVSTVLQYSNTPLLRLCGGGKKLVWENIDHG